jgi:hypothetical protein
MLQCVIFNIQKIHHKNDIIHLIKYLAGTGQINLSCDQTEHRLQSPEFNASGHKELENASQKPEIVHLIKSLAGTGQPYLSSNQTKH